MSGLREFLSSAEEVYFSIRFRYLHVLADISDLKVLLVFEPDSSELFLGEDALSFIPKLVGLLCDENSALRCV